MKLVQERLQVKVCKSTSKEKMRKEGKAWKRRGRGCQGSGEGRGVERIN